MVKSADLVSAYNTLRELNEAQRKLDSLANMESIRVIISRDSVNRQVFSYKDSVSSDEYELSEIQSEKIRNVITDGLKETIEVFKIMLRSLGVDEV